MEEQTILEKLRTLELGAITDAMNLLGIDGWLNRVRPVSDGRMVGRAFPVQYSFVKDDAQQAYAYYPLLDHAAPGDVLVLATGNCAHAIMGENMQHAALRMKCAGMIVDGKIRDTGIVRDVALPVFCTGSAVRFMPSNFKITGFNVPVTCGDILVSPGDYLVGDVDGVIALSEQCAERVVALAEKIMVVENQMEQALNSGRPMAECLQVIGQKKHLQL